MTPELREALSNAYQVFAPYKDEFQMARTCAINRPLHQLTFEDWRVMSARFDISVLLWSDISFRHFLPMLMEWHSEDEKRNNHLFWPVDVLYRLERFGWLRWPSEEVDAIRRVLRIWTQQALEDKRRFPPLPLALEEDLNSYFNPWLEKRPLEVAQWLMVQNWEHPQASLLRWVSQHFVADAFESAFWANPDNESASLFSRVLQLLDSLREPDI